MSDDILQKVSIELNPGEQVSHVLVILAIETMNDFEAEIRVTGTPHTNRIMRMGMLSEALEESKYPTYEEVEDEDDDE